MLTRRQVRGVLKKMVEDSSDDIDIYDWLGRVSFEAVCQAAIGHSFNAIDDPNGHPYCRALKAFMYAHSQFFFAALCSY